MSTIGAYLRERFPVTLFGPVCLVLTAAASWSVVSVTAPRLTATLLLGIVLVVQFRLWDDLEDRTRDRTRHPARVLVNAPVRPFHAVLLILMSVSVALSAQQGAALAAVLGLNAAFWCGYRLARPSLSTNAWSFGLLLLKYPGFIGVMALSIGDVIPARLAAAAATSYVCASGYELLHDRPARVGDAS